MPRSVDSGTPSRVNPSALDARRVVWFVGPDASRSSAVAALPRWAEILARPMELRPADLAPGADPSVYVRIFNELVGDPRAIGAVVTSHKTGMWAAVGQRCRLSEDARRLRETSVLAVRDGVVEGHATDVISVGAAVDHLWPRADGTVVCLGGGGSARALCRHLITRLARPTRILVCEPDEIQAALLRELFPPSETAGVDLQVLTGRAQWGNVVAGTEAGCLVVNATGLGKTDGRSPLSPAVRDPLRATVWDLNYRGILPVLTAARRQQQNRQLVVADGTRLFALGWLAALGVLFDIGQTASFTDQFIAVAEDVRS